MAVQGDQPVRGEQDLAAARQLHPGLGHGEPVREPVHRPEPGPDSEDPLWLGGRQGGDGGRVSPGVVAAGR